MPLVRPIKTDQFQIDLLFKKWRISESLKKVKVEIEKISNESQVKDSITKHIEHFKNLVNELISIYSLFENFRRDQNLADYVANAVAVSTNLISDSDKFKDEIYKSDKKISYNLIWKQYQSTRKSFKQFVFPFAHSYFKGTHSFSKQLPEHFVEKLAEYVGEKIDDLISELKNYKATITEQDKRTEFSPFTTNDSEPFYVWTNKGGKNSLSKLLGGEVVTIMANLMNSGSAKDAMKFKTIELTFTSTNATAQREIE